MTETKEYSNFDAIVDLCLLAEKTKNISTSEHFAYFGRVIKEVYHEEDSLGKALVRGLSCDLAITVARATFQLSKIYYKIPKKFMPSFINENSLIGICAENLREMNKYDSLP